MIEVKITADTVYALAEQVITFSGPFAAMLVQPGVMAAVEQAVEQAVNTGPPQTNMFPPSDNIGSDETVTRAAAFDYEKDVKPRASAVVKRIGMEQTKQLLAAGFGVKRPIDLKPEQFAQFMSETEKLVS